MPLGNELIPSIGQAAASGFSAAAGSSLPPSVVVVGGAIIATVKILDIIVNGVDSSA